MGRLGKREEKGLRGETDVEAASVSSSAMRWYSMKIL